MKFTIGALLLSLSIGFIAAMFTAIMAEHDGRNKHLPSSAFATVFVFLWSVFTALLWLILTGLHDIIKNW